MDSETLRICRIALEEAQKSSKLLNAIYTPRQIDAALKKLEKTIKAREWKAESEQGAWVIS